MSSVPLKQRPKGDRVSSAAKRSRLPLRSQRRKPGCDGWGGGGLPGSALPPSHFTRLLNIAHPSRIHTATSPALSNDQLIINRAPAITPAVPNKSRGNHSNAPGATWPVW